MKCPKCSYLGFETGNTCKNCGYDFSLLADIQTDSAPNDRIDLDLDLDLRTVDSDLAAQPEWSDAADAMLTDSEPVLHIQDEIEEEIPAPPIDEPPPILPITAAAPEPPLPLFTPTFGDSDDEPLVKLPATPRPPLAVRRTPDTPRLRVVPKPVRSSAERAPVLAFEPPDPEPDDAPAAVSEAPPPAAATAPRASRIWAQPAKETPPISAPGVRIAAAAVDHLLLGGVDIVVIYFTTRIAGLTMADWVTLPPGPMVAFLLMLKFAYFAAFTAVGGQTIGKMALGLRVIGEERFPIDGAIAVKRTLAGAVSGLTLGLAYLPMFFDSERRTLHDRIARTRVVSSPSA